MSLPHATVVENTSSNRFMIQYRKKHQGKIIHRTYIEIGHHICRVPCNLCRKRFQKHITITINTEISSVISRQQCLSLILKKGVLYINSSFIYIVSKESTVHLTTGFHRSVHSRYEERTMRSTHF